MNAFVTGWAIVAALFTVVALVRLSKVRRLPPQRTRRHPPVLLIRPVDAPTPLELENLATPIDYPGQLTHLVVSPFRPRLGSANVRWLPSDPLTKSRKVGHIAYALATQQRALADARDFEATTDERLELLGATADQVVLCIDADVRVDSKLVNALLDELRDGAALSSAAPRPAPSDTLGGRAMRGLLVQSHHAFEVLDVMSAGAPAICGKAIALSPAAAAELVRLPDVIGEDLELAQVLHERGLPVTLAKAHAVVPLSPSLRVSSVLERFTRWMQVLRAHRPALFPTVPLLFAPTPMVLMLAALVATPHAAIAAAMLFTARLLLASRQDERRGLRLEWVLAEVLLWACWLNALRLGGAVHWRGRHFVLQRGGRMLGVAR